MQTATSDPFQHEPDEVLLGLIKQRNAGAFAALYDRHAAMAYDLLLRVSRSPAVAEELLQETFWQVWQKAEQYEGAGTVAGWLLRIARNKALDELRRSKARGRGQHVELEKLETLSLYRYPNVEQQVEQGWSRQHICQALNHIPPEQRVCLELVFYEGMSHSEVAEQMQIPLGTIKTRVRSGLEKVERYLRGIGYSERYA
jgi:RNA polymerase sigma-70 factor (ECF subfamily)